MAIAATNRDASTTVLTAATQTSASIAFQNNTLYIFSFAARKASGVPTVSSLVGGGLTWTKKASTASATTHNHELWEGWAASGATTGTVAITISTTAAGWMYAINEFTGVDTTTRIIQPTANTPAAGLSSAVTLATFASSNNVAYGQFGHNANEGSTVDATATYTALSNNFGATFSLITEYKTPGTDTSVSASWATSIAAGGCACEINAATVAAAPPRLPAVVLQAVARASTR